MTKTSMHWLSYAAQFLATLLRVCHNVVRDYVSQYITNHFNCVKQVLVVNYVGLCGEITEADGGCFLGRHYAWW